MTENRPLISIVMPTMNRAALLADSLRSALEQDFNDFEIVVSDNHSTDETASTVRRLGGERVRMVRPDRPLSLPEHFEFAFNHAKGRFVVFLPDDDALTPVCLSVAAAAVAERNDPLFVWPMCFYYSEGFDPIRAQNTLLVMPHSGTIERVNAITNVMLTCYNLYMSRWPQFVNCIYSVDFLRSIQNRVGRLFPVMGSDLFTGLLALAEINDYPFLDRPLSVYRGHMQSLSASMYNDPRVTLLPYLVEHPEEHPLPEVPLKSLVPTNFFISNLLRAKAALGARADDWLIDWKRYFVAVYLELKKLEERGHDVAVEMVEWESALRDRPAELQNDVRGSITRQTSGGWKSRLRKFVDANPNLTEWDAKLRPRIGRSRPIVFRGSEAGFTNIYECARSVPDLLVRGFVEGTLGRRVAVT